MATTVNPKQSPAAANPSPTELLHDLTSGIAGIGLVFVSFLGAIPGLLPGVLLAVLLGAVVVVPMLVVGVAIGAAYGLLVLVARVGSRGLSVVTRARVARDRPRPAPVRAVLRTLLGRA